MNKLILSVLAMSLVVGCSKKGEFSALLDEYQTSGKIEHAVDVIDTASRMLEKEIFDDLDDHEMNQILRLVSLSLTKEHFDVFYDAYNISDTELSQNQYEQLDSSYHGSNAKIHELLGAWHLRQGNIKSAYARFVTSAMIDKESAAGVKYLLQHYGCTATASVWAELAKENYTFLSKYEPGGEKYPELPAAIPLDELIRQRKELRQGNPPNIQAGCPINLYE